MKHFIQHSHKGRPLLLVALLAVFIGAAKAQDAGTVSVHVTWIDPLPYTPVRVNTVAKMYSTTSATAGPVDATVNITNDFYYGGYSRATSVTTIYLPKNTALPVGVGDTTLSYKIPFPGSWTAGSTSTISAPGTTTVTSISAQGFTVTQ